MESITEDAVSADIENLLERTIASSPEIAAARADVQSSRETINVVRSSGMPILAANARFDEFYRESGPKEEYTGGISISFPIFDGWANSYAVRKARSDADLAAANLESLRKQKALSVWTDYYAHKTAVQQIKTSLLLNESAQKSYDVALGRYKEGVGSILDLLSSQAALEQARASLSNARGLWLLSLAQLRFDVGILTQESLSHPAIPEEPE
jgi:outer membrane protein TolC